MEPRPIQRDLMIATEIIALSHREGYDPFQAITASTNMKAGIDARVLKYQTKTFDHNLIA